MNGLAPTASPIALTLSSGATSSMAMEIDVFIAATSTLPASDTTCSIRHFKHVSCGCTSSSGEVGPVSGWKLSVAKVFSDFSTCSLPSTSFKIQSKSTQNVTRSLLNRQTSNWLPVPFQQRPKSTAASRTLLTYSAIRDGALRNKTVIKSQELSIFFRKKFKKKLSNKVASIKKWKRL